MPIYLDPEAELLGRQAYEQIHTYHLAVCVCLRLHLLRSAGRGETPAGIPSVGGEAAA